MIQRQCDSTMSHGAHMWYTGATNNILFPYREYQCHGLNKKEILQNSLRTQGFFALRLLMAHPLGGIPITVANLVLLPELPRKGDFIQLDADQVNDGIDKLGWYVDYAVFHNDDSLIILLVK